jgi:hypothetical protein
LPSATVCVVVEERSITSSSRFPAPGSR